MFNRLGKFVSSSIGRKMVMSLTGLLLFCFVLGHLAGNLTLFAGDGGVLFDAYADTLRSNPLLPVAEAGLIVLFLGHVFLAFRTTIDNREARKQGYKIRNKMGAATIASSSMFVTGALVLGFLIVHLLDFRLNAAAEETPLSAMVFERFSQPVGAALYLVGVLALGVHLSHAFRSGLQSLGVNHPRWNPLIQRAGIGLAALIFVGFAAMPIAFFMQGAPERSEASADASPTTSTTSGEGAQR